MCCHASDPMQNCNRTSGNEWTGAVHPATRKQRKTAALTPRLVKFPTTMAPLHTGQCNTHTHTLGMAACLHTTHALIIHLCTLLYTALILLWPYSGLVFTVCVHCKEKFPCCLLHVNFLSFVTQPTSKRGQFHTPPQPVFSNSFWLRAMRNFHSCWFVFPLSSILSGLGLWCLVFTGTNQSLATFESKCESKWQTTRTQAWKKKLAVFGTLNSY